MKDSKVIEILGKIKYGLRKSKSRHEMYSAVVEDFCKYMKIPFREEHLCSFEIFKEFQNDWCVCLGEDVSFSVLKMWRHHLKDLDLKNKVEARRRLRFYLLQWLKKKGLWDGLHS